MTKKKICQKCGKKFIPERSDQRFCQNCKNKVIKTKCTICNKTFVLSKYQKRYWLEGKEDFYCSYACAKKVDKHQKYKKICDKCK